MHKIDSGILNAILQYLAKQPYDQVFQLINGIQQSCPIVEEKPQEELPKKELDKFSEKYAETNDEMYKPLN